MKNTVFILSVMSFTIFISCSTKNFFIEQEYKDKKITDATLLIPKIGDVKIDQDEQNFTAAELDSLKNKYIDYLNNGFNNVVQRISTFKNVGYLEFKKKPEFENRSFNLNGEDIIEISVPKNKISIESGEKIFILFLENGRIFLTKDQRETSDPAKHYSVTATPGRDINLSKVKFFDNNFVFTAKYFLYDNNQAKVVLGGILTAKSRFSEQTDFDNLMKTITDKIAKEILTNSPFYN